jgi:hypothetical protein
MPRGCAYYLNQLHPEHDGRYAEVITSDIPDAAGRNPAVQKGYLSDGGRERGHADDRV